MQINGGYRVIMKKIKKIAAMLLAGTFMLSALCGCNGNGSGDDSGKVDTTNTVTDKAETSDAPDDTSAEAAGSTTMPETSAPSPTVARDPSGKYRVLFIGNSFTYYNDMNKPNGNFYSIAKNAGYNVIVDSVYKGAYALRQFLDEKDTYGKQVRAKLGANKYDIVIIQEQSYLPISDPGDFYDSCREFKKLIEANGAEMWLYETWGYKTGHSALAAYGRSTADMEMKLRAAYAAIGDELGVPVMYAGAAFSKVFAEDPKIELYHTDSKHPGVNGSYLIAWTIFGSTFGVDPASLTYNGILNAGYAATLRAAASEIVRNGAPVDDGYCTSSVGVVRVIKQSYVDAAKTKMLTSAPSSPIISVITRDSAVVGDGWMRMKSDAGKTFSGIRGDKDKVASPECSDTALSDAQRADIADIGYGVSVIGITHMDSTKKGAMTTATEAGNTNSVMNLVNGHWGSSYMAAMFFDEDMYRITGEMDNSSHYTGLITLNFGSKMTFDAIGYMSGSLKGFPQAQDVFVSDDGVNWTKVESACYDVLGTPLKSVSDKARDPWNNNNPTVEVLFSMSGVSGKYIRIGIYRGGEVNGNTTGLDAINTRELVVHGKAAE